LKCGSELKKPSSKLILSRKRLKKLKKSPLHGKLKKQNERLPSVNHSEVLSSSKPKCVSRVLIYREERNVSFSLKRNLSTKFQRLAGLLLQRKKK
jgi:hypothetical protein